MATYSMDFERPVIELEDKLIELKSLKGAQEEDVKKEIQYLEGQLDKLKKLVYADLTPWQRVQVDPANPTEEENPPGIPDRQSSDSWCNRTGPPPCRSCACRIGTEPDCC